MKMIRAILRPETAEGVSETLADAGFVSMTQIHVFGRGKQKGLQVGPIYYDELPKTLLMLVVEDEAAKHAVENPLIDRTAQRTVYSWPSRRAVVMPACSRAPRVPSP